MAGDGRPETGHRIGTRDEWLAARESLLAREKEHTRLGDELARQRRELPWVRVEKDYRFDTDDGERTLAELFDGRSQLLVYHFMFGPSYEAGCAMNSSIADTIDGLLPHLHARDVTCPRLARPDREAADVQAPHGLEHPLGVVRPHDFNSDLGFSHARRDARVGRGEIGVSLPPIVEHNARPTARTPPAT